MIALLNPHDPVCTQNTLHPDYPAASPYVTSVGATQLNSEVFKLTNPPPVCKTLQCASGGTETAVSYQVSSFTSGGGFSDYAAQPDYQTKVVGAYLSSGTALPPSTYFNASGRGYPDVAALGHNFLVYDSSEGGFFAVGGTSASSPSFAGYASFLNAAALKKDNKPLGFLNPLFYKMYDEQPNTFRDITVGDNICTENGCTASCKGYRCAAGWDPVTGLGVPDVTQILNYVNANL
jgi:subtilase family serine protease